MQRCAYEAHAHVVSLPADVIITVDAHSALQLCAHLLLRSQVVLKGFYIPTDHLHSIFDVLDPLQALLYPLLPSQQLLQYIALC